MNAYGVRNFSTDFLCLWCWDLGALSKQMIIGTARSHAFQYLSQMHVRTWVIPALEDVTYVGCGAREYFGGFPTMLETCLKYLV